MPQPQFSLLVRDSSPYLLAKNIVLLFFVQHTVFSDFATTLG